MIRFFMEKLLATPNHVAFLSDNDQTTYGQLKDLVEFFDHWLKREGIAPGAVVSFDGDYSPHAIGLFLALAKNRNIIVPLSLDSRHNFDEFRRIACTEYDVSLSTQPDKNAEPIVTRTGRDSRLPLYETLRDTQAPGLILFSSGSTGKSKAIVQNLNSLMGKFKTPRPQLRMLIFLQLDHIGGVNSLLYALANQGTVIKAEGRTPESVCAAIERHRAELLPTSPTFLNLILLSKAYAQHDLSSLKVITLDP